MKRAASFNPVYPFDEQTQPSTALPPFFSSDGLEEQPGGKLALKITNPLGFDLDGHLKLKLGEGMRINVNGALEADQNLSAQDPLSLQNDQLSLKYNSSSMFVNGSGELDIMHQQTLTAEAPLAIEEDKIKLKLTAPLIVKNGNLFLNLHATAPINLNQNVLQLDVEEKGLKIENSKLKLKLQTPLYFTPDNLVGIERLTMWTGTGNDNNIILNRGGTSKNGRVDLVLSKMGDLVHGMVRMTANLTSTVDCECMLYFNPDTAEYNVARSDLKENFGFKIGDQMSTIYNKNLGMVPNILFYPRHTASSEDNWRVYDRHMVGTQLKLIHTNPFILMQIVYNQMPTNDMGFSLYFKWKPTSNTLQTGWTFFSYVAQQ
uniref:Fiber protein n=1 Tax=Bat mastadenovirus TaxID=740971 RepID=A0A8G0RF09_9ADEN|nr:fiber protein [Bat mastadenovirus]